LSCCRFSGRDVKQSHLAFELNRAEKRNVIEKLIAALKVETKETMVISTLVLEEITSYHEQFVIGFTDELTELIEALNRNHAATDGARKATRAHEEKSRTKEPQESSSAKAIREFLARQRGRPSN
jgi:predicted nucleic acid-binding protein